MRAAGTHALVIGTSYYRHLDRIGFGLAQAVTPASSAWKFACWLRSSYTNPEAPLSTLRLLLSPSAEEVQANPELGHAGQPATLANVQQALYDWSDDCRTGLANVAVLYVSGHGVQESKEDLIVLLEDFAADRNAMVFALDVGQVFNGMAGGNVAQTQLYFVDACRIRPDIFDRFRHLGSPLGLPEEWHGEDRRCAPIYCSASPGTQAYGEIGAGTLFSQALLRCLGGLAATSPTLHRHAWHVTTSSLAPALERAVAELAKEHEVEQTVVTGGSMRSAVFHVFPSPPLVDLTIQLLPPAAGPYSKADLWDYDRRQRLLSGESFNPDRLKRQVPAGLYSLDVKVARGTRRFVSRRGLPLVVEPSAAWWPVEMT